MWQNPFCQSITSGFLASKALLSHWSLWSVWVFARLANTTQALPPPPHLFCVQRVFWLVFHEDTIPRWDLRSSLNFHGTSFLFAPIGCHAVCQTVLLQPLPPFNHSSRTNTIAVGICTIFLLPRLLWYTVEAERLLALMEKTVVRTSWPLAFNTQSRASRSTLLVIESGYWW